jgi:imidazoleglycerol-phosphate dehydratase/histidinol-phosphatase
MSGERILFIDRDGTIIEEPPDEKVDSLQKLRLLPGVIPALLELQRAGYRLVLVSNQDGLGTQSFPEPSFREPQDFLRTLLASQGIEFDAEFFCPHFPADDCSCRKPRTGLLTDFLAAHALDRQHSYVVGDRETDMQLAANLGLEGLRVRADGAFRLVYVAKFADGVRVAVTGATTGVTRWPEAEAAIVAGASLEGLMLQSDDLAADIHAGADFRAHLAGVMLRKAAGAVA